MPFGGTKLYYLSGTGRYLGYILAEVEGLGRLLRMAHRQSKRILVVLQALDFRYVTNCHDPFTNVRSGHPQVGANPRLLPDFWKAAADGVFRKWRAVGCHEQRPVP